MDKIIKEGKFKIYEGKSVKECLTDCLNDGHIPLNIDSIRMLQDNSTLSKNRWYDSSTILINGIYRDATLDELKNVDNFYENGGRIICGNISLDNSHLLTNNNLNDDGRFVGVPLDNAYTFEKSDEEKEGYAKKKILYGVMEGILLFRKERKAYVRSEKSFYK